MKKKKIGDEEYLGWVIDDNLVNYVHRTKKKKKKIQKQVSCSGTMIFIS